MSRPFTHALASALAGAVASVATLSAAFLLFPGIVFEMDRDVPRATAGFSPVERHLDETYAWSGQRAQVALPGLDRDVAWACVVRLRGGRPPGVPQPQVQIAADGVTMRTESASNTYRDIHVAVPGRGGRHGLSLTITSEPTWVPGPGDPRALGVQVDRIACTPDGAAAWPPARSLVAVAGSGAALGAAFALAGVGIVAAGALTMLASVGQAMIVASGTAAFGAWPDRTITLGLAIALAMLLLVKGIEAARRQTLSPLAASAIAVSALALHLKLLALLHPAKPIIDAVFHAHRFEWVQAGRYFFSQTMPDGVQFPYAIALYVFALPWAAFTSDHVLLLRVVVCVVEALAGVLLYPMVVRTWGDRLAGLAAVALYALVPLAFIVVGNANMTNAFGRSAALVAVAAAVCWPLAGRRAGWSVAGLTLLVSVALLSHVSTLSLLVATLLSAAVLTWWLGTRDERGRAVWLATSVVLAAVVSVGVYYGHFADVFRTLERVRARAVVGDVATPGQGAAAVAAVERTGDRDASGVKGTMASELPGRVLLAVSLSQRAVGWPVFVLSVVGMWRLWARGVRDRLGVMLLAWGGTWVVFVAVVMMAPVDARFQRYAVEFLDRVNYTLSPAFALLAGLAWAWAWRAGLTWRVVASVLCAAAAFVGGQQLVLWLR